MECGLKPARRAARGGAGDSLGIKWTGRDVPDRRDAAHRAGRSATVRLIACSGGGGERGKEAGDGGAAQGGRRGGTQGQSADRQRESSPRRRCRRGTQTGRRRDPSHDQGSTRVRRGTIHRHMVIFIHHNNGSSKKEYRI